MSKYENIMFKPLPTQKSLNSKKNLFQVRFLFSSFIAADVKQASKVLKSFIMQFSTWLHQRRVMNTKIQCTKTSSNSYYNKKNNKYQVPNVGKYISQLQNDLNPKSESVYIVDNISKEMVWAMKYQTMVKTIHDHGSLKANYQLPNITQLRTVIRSPHVFKKTREQFGSVKCVTSHDYYFVSNTCALLFINIACLLKFPVEVQIQLSSGK